MDVQRTVTICSADDPDLRATLAGLQDIQQRISPLCYNNGKPLSALALQRAVDAQVKGTLSSQLTCTPIRLVAASSAAGRANQQPARCPLLQRRMSTQRSTSAFALRCSGSVGRGQPALKPCCPLRTVRASRRQMACGS